MVKLSVIILTSNEEDFIAKAIRSVKWADQILVVDTDSIDKTREIAQKNGAFVIEHPFTDFSAQRNFALSYVKNDLVLYLDADEEVNEELRKNIEKEVSNPNFHAYSLTRVNFYLGKEWPKKEQLTRLFWKKYLLGWEGKVHETAKVEGPTGEISGALIHHTHRSLESMIKKTLVWSAIEANLRLDAGHPPVTWWRIFRVMMTAFWNSYIRERGFQVGTVGLIESVYQSYSIFITYARLWELQQGQKDSK